jgi:hypothetical protein
MRSTTNPGFTVNKSKKQTVGTQTAHQSHLHLVLVRPAPQLSYERAMFATLSERTYARVLKEWREADFEQEFSALQSYIRDPAPSLDETSCRFGLDPEELRLQVYRLRVDWLEVLADEAEGLLQDINPESARTGTQGGGQSGVLEPNAANVPDDAYQLLVSKHSSANATVYVARHCRSNEVVALKVWNASVSFERIHQLLESVQQLRHPNIVHVREVGVLGDRTCITMDSVDGGTLADVEWRAHFRQPARAGALVAKLACAMQFAHEHMILHGDIKPSNVLLTAEGEPKLSDFGLFRACEGDPSQTPAHVNDYAAPERADPEQGPTVATDIYSLGAILYELLSSRVPPRDQSLRRDRQSSHALAHWLPKHQLLPQVNRDLEAVCLTALDPLPQRRYRTAAEFANDLERALTARPTLARPPGIGGRVALWARRHPSLAWIVGIAAIAVLLACGSTASMLHSRRELLQSTMRANATLATLQAAQLAKVFEEYADRVHELASDPQIRAIATGTQSADALPASAHGFDSIFIVDLSGAVRAHWPTQLAAEYYANNFSFRDYFRGAQTLPCHPGAETRNCVYLSRVFRSRADDRNLKLALSSPVFNDRGKRIGVLAATKSVSTSLERIPFTLYGGQTVELLAPRDRDRAEQELPSAYTVVVHADVDEKSEYAVSAHFAKDARARFGQAAAPGEQFEWKRVEPLIVEDYLDPVPNYEGRWVAGFYPVAQTGYVVGVGTRHIAPSAIVNSLILVNSALALGGLALITWSRRGRVRASRI